MATTVIETRRIVATISEIAGRPLLSGRRKRYRLSGSQYAITRGSQIGKHAQLTGSRLHCLQTQAPLSVFVSGLPQ